VVSQVKQHRPPGSAFTTYRKQLLEVLLGSVHVIDGPAPGPDHVWSQRRDRLLDLVFYSDDDPAVVGRKFALRALLTGDIQHDKMLLHSPGGASDRQRRAWAKSLASALMPCRVEPVTRSRWLSALTPLTQCCLLANTHNLLERVTLRFVRAMAGKRMPPVVILESEWDVPSESEDEAPALEPPRGLQTKR
jgi:hypothetical protein